MLKRLFIHDNWIQQKKKSMPKHAKAEEAAVLAS